MEKLWMSFCRLGWFGCFLLLGPWIGGCVVEPNVIYCDKSPTICPIGTFCWNETFCVNIDESNGASEEQPPELPAWEEAPPPVDGGETWPEWDVGMPEFDCPNGLTNCTGTCVDLSNNSEHCGLCFLRCAAHQTCGANVCVP